MHSEIVTLQKIVGGGQTLGTLADGRKLFVWGGLPNETVEVAVVKKKSKYAEGVVMRVIEPSSERMEPKDSESYLSTSPWQIMTFSAERHYKAALVEEAFELHDIVLPEPIDIASDGNEYHYRNKVEFSWYGSEKPTVDSQQSTVGHLQSTIQNPKSTSEQLDLAFFRRGTKGKLPVDGTSLARPEINKLSRHIRDTLVAKDVIARELKTLLIRSDQQGNCVWQLYIKDKQGDILSPEEALSFGAQGGEVIYSDPKSPASRITERLASFGDVVLQDTILNTPFRYATEGFFQINLPVYEIALRDIKKWIDTKDTVVDLYSGVGSIGLTIGGDALTLVEINEDAVREMRANIEALGKNARAVLAPSEKALEYITANSVVIVDPPRAGLHTDVINRLLETKPRRIIYLSCNPVTQARDVALLASTYGIRYHRGYNFFPRTPHIEHLVILDLI